MTYALITTRSAEKEISALTPDYQRRIGRQIAALRVTPFPPASKKLKGSLRGFRLRVGDYRVFYEVDDEERAIVISAVRHRREAYR